MAESHPEIDAEQAYIDRAYTCLEANRNMARRLDSNVEVGAGGTNQARFERDVLEETKQARLRQLDFGDAALVFGRVDFGLDSEVSRNDLADVESFYIGRVAVSDQAQDPVVVDWRAPVAEPFYRATGRADMGLVRRRHFATRGRQLLGLEDELFGAALLGLDSSDSGRTVVGEGALMAALNEARTGRLTDIVATIQAEQDEIIRSELPGVLVVQGGPGTGKTVVALHRAAYLLYTYRFPLEGQGVLVLGPNRLFLGYIEQVLPSLGEAGAEVAVLSDLLSPKVRVLGRDEQLASRVKGDLRMVSLIKNAVLDRERPLREPLIIGFGLQRLRLSVSRSAEIVNNVRRRAKGHNAGRKLLEAEVFRALADSARDEVDPASVRDQHRWSDAVREALEWMWPVLSPPALLRDLFSSEALLRSAARSRLSSAEVRSLHRPGRPHVEDVVWTIDDVPLLDEARARLGRRPRHKAEDEVRTYGHIVIDEAQDLSPMQLRMVSRRSLNGSLTIVGDIAQSTGAWAHGDWEEILEHLPNRRPHRRSGLTVGYRIPAPLMGPASRVLRYAAPDLQPPKSVRQEGDPPEFVRVDGHELADEVVAAVRRETDAVGVGNLAVIVPTSLVEPLRAAFLGAGLDFGVAPRDGLEHQVTMVPVGYVKGLELDSSIVVEPAAIVEEEPQGLRSLYVALTRSTQRLVIVHRRLLPEALHEGPSASPSSNPLMREPVALSLFET